MDDWMRIPAECAIIQNDHKGCTLDYLDGLGHFHFGFGATGKNKSYHPLGGRGLKQNKMFGFYKSKSSFRHY